MSTENVVLNNDIDGKYRFGISLLSKKNYKDAYNEEVIIDKETGEVLVKIPDGSSVMSYNYNSRLKSHINEIKNDANNLSIYGDILNIELGDTGGPFKMEHGINYIDTPIEIPYARTNRVLFHVDIDPIVKNNENISFNRVNACVGIGFKVLYANGSESDVINITNPLSKFNTTVLSLVDGSITPTVSSRVTGIKIVEFKVLNDIMDYNNNLINIDSEIHPIFNSLFAILEIV